MFKCIKLLLPLQPIYARKKIDISWCDIIWFFYTLIFRSWDKKYKEAETAIEKQWTQSQTLATLTVRSGFDLCLQAYSFPPGSEIIISAVTIPDMVSVIKHHNLIPIPIDIQEDGSISYQDIMPLITRQTKGILIAHLFGNMIDMIDIVSVAKEQSLVLFEDCAQAFHGRVWRGSADVDVSMFSFGGIKTCTAFGGGILTIKNLNVLERMKEIQHTYPVQNTSTFLKRVGKYSLFKALTDSPYAYGLFLAVLKRRGINRHLFIRNLTRSFHSPETLMQQLRYQPSIHLLSLLSYRITSFNSLGLLRRKRRIESLASEMSVKWRLLGLMQENNHYWLCPVWVGDVKGEVERVVEGLCEAGFDGVGGEVSLEVVGDGESGGCGGSERDGKGSENVERARKIMRGLVYLPFDHEFGRREVGRLVDVLEGNCQSGLRKA